MKRQYTSKCNPCPICGNHHGCAIREDSLIECLRSFTQQDAPLGYRFIKLLRNDMGGLFTKDDRSDSLTASEEWRGKQERLHDSSKKVLGIKKCVEAQGLVARHDAFWLVLQKAATTLSTQHYSHLQERRQLTTDEITWLHNLGWVRTWKPGLYAPEGVTSDLPGISAEGKLLGMPGIAIAALDPSFRITGFQIATLRTEPKYIWLSGNNHGGNGPQLPNRELPLFCWKHPDSKKAKVVILCEGALKSLLVAMFLWRAGQSDIAVIGTASAARYGEKTLKNYLKRLGAKEIHLMPDAGTLANLHITKACQATIYSLRKWSYRVSVGNWGQLHTKEHLDIDELLAASRYNEIQLITAAKFILQCQQTIQIHKLLKSGSFYLTGCKQVELRPIVDAISNWKQIHLYFQGIQTLRKADYEVIVAWNNLYLQPEDFFALCPESIQKQLAQSEREWGMLYKLKLWLHRMVERYRPKMGFGRQTAEAEATKTNSQLVVDGNKRLSTNTSESNVINYKPGKLPLPGEYKLPPKILFKKGQRLQVLQETIAAGWKHILDSSPTGTFKSYDAGNALLEALGVRQLWYFSSQARNVTTEAVKHNYAYLEVRNDGMVWQSSPSGKKYLRWPKNGEIAETSGNCHRTKVFAIFREKNISEIEDLENPVCATCHLLEACRSNSGSGFGHRFLRQETLKRWRIRSHPDSAPDTNNYDWDRCGNFWDEVMRTVQPISFVTAKLVDLDRVIAELTTHYPNLNEQLLDLWTVLRQCLRGEIKQPFYGWNDAAVRKLLPEPPDNLDEIIAAATEILHPHLTSLFNITSNYGVNLADLPKTMRKRFGNNTFELTEKIQQNIILNWFVPFLKVWGKCVKGALRIDQGKIFIYTRNERHSALALASAWNVYLDATATAEYLSWWMDVDCCEILTIKQEVSESKNLDLVQVVGLGQLGKNRSALCQKRVTALRQELQQRHPDIKFIEWKCQAESADGGWFVDSRGSNDFNRVSALATIGIPYTNLGYLEALYLTLTGRTIEPGLTTVKVPIGVRMLDNPDVALTDSVDPYFERTVSADHNFQAFVDWSTQSEIYQALGRLRSHLRQEENLSFYFIGDYPLKMPVRVVQACDITIEAGSRWEQTWFKIEKAAKQLIESGACRLRGIKTAIAHAVGCSVGLISKDYRDALDKLLQSLLNPFSRTCKHSQPVNPVQPEAELIGASVMPLLAESDPMIMLHDLLSPQRYLERQYWQWIVSATPIESQIKIINALLLLFCCRHHGFLNW